MPGQYDVVFIGGGPGGYNGAIRAAQLGLKTAVVEKTATLGGTCLNVGCIPSKALLHASARFEEAVRHFPAIGIRAELTLDLPAMMNHRAKTVEGLTKGIEFLFKKNKIDWIKGTGRIAGAGKVAVTLTAGGEDHVVTRRGPQPTGFDTDMAFPLFRGKSDFHQRFRPAEKPPCKAFQTVQSSHGPGRDALDGPFAIGQFRVS